ncbi:MAG: hypothetical protein NTV08_07600 [Verrucomicrobia bacterium]|nr:hypothetical protein [Verrucomicrobiota bacterium]
MVVVFHADALRLILIPKAHARRLPEARMLAAYILRRIPLDDGLHLFRPPTADLLLLVLLRFLVGKHGRSRGSIIASVLIGGRRLCRSLTLLRLRIRVIGGWYRPRIHPRNVRIIAALLNRRVQRLENLPRLQRTSLCLHLCILPEQEETAQRRAAVHGARARGIIRSTVPRPLAFPGRELALKLKGTRLLKNVSVRFVRLFHPFLADLAATEHRCLQPIFPENSPQPRLARLVRLTGAIHPAARPLLVERSPLRRQRAGTHHRERIFTRHTFSLPRLQRDPVGADAKVKCKYAATISAARCLEGNLFHKESEV